LLLVPQAVSAPADVPLPSGVWRAWLDSEGGELPFRLEVQRDDDGLRAWLLNGDDRSPATTASSSGDRVVFEWTDFDSVLQARIEVGGTVLTGTWERQVTATQRVQLPFHARFGDDWRSTPAMPLLAPGQAPGTGLAGNRIEASGRYHVRFEGDDQPVIGVLQEAESGSLAGTFVTKLADYRFLVGRREGRGITLSGFDGAQAYLFRGEFDDDGGLHGRLWSSASAARAWSARRDDAAALPEVDAHAVVRGRIGDVALPDLDGRRCSLADPELRGDACLVLVFGSWSPTCHDATDTVAAMLQRYRTRGLRAVGLAFELTGDADHSRRVLQAYAQRHSVEWPILLAGVAHEKPTGSALPFLEPLVAYPTVLFVAKDGTIAHVHRGFIGPAAASEHRALLRDWRTHIEALLR